MELNRKKKWPSLIKSSEGDDIQKAMDAALRLLSFRPRTRREIELRLLKKGFEKEVIHRTCKRLEEIGYIDDQQFAISWIRAHSGSRCRSAWMLRRELEHKGIDPAIAENAVEETYKEEEAFKEACELARQRTLKTNTQDTKKMKARLQNLLLRRGFGYDFIRDVLAEVIKEK